MSFHCGPGLRDMMVRLSGKRPGSIGTAGRFKDKRRRCGARPFLEALEPLEPRLTYPLPQHRFDPLQCVCQRLAAVQLHPDDVTVAPRTPRLGS
jgi:hypothetical protein